MIGPVSRRAWMLVFISLTYGALARCSGGDSEEASDALADLDAQAEATAEVQAPPQVVSLRALIDGSIEQKVRVVVDQDLEGTYDLERIEAFVTAQRLKEANDFSVLTTTDQWWQDYQDYADILYYSAEHVFSDSAPYPGAVFSPMIWDDVIYTVPDVSVEYADLSGLYEAGQARKIQRQAPSGATWTLLSANDAFAWARERFAHEPNEMVVLVSDHPALAQDHHSYYFIEEDYGAARGFEGHFMNPTFDQWPAAMQEAEGLEPHDVPIWMHFAFLNGEWDAAAGSWRLFPNGRWGGYEDANVYVIEVARDLALETRDCDTTPQVPASHFALDEEDFKRCLDDTERLLYDWYRLWRHGFNTPSFPFWWSEKIDLRVVLVDLRDQIDGAPEYEVDQVIDFQTFEDAIREANPFVHLDLQTYLYEPPADVKEVLATYFINEAEYPLHSEVGLYTAGGDWRTFHMDWHHHVDISGLPGLQVYLAEQLAGYFGGMDEDGPRDYHPFAEPYAKSGEPFVMPAIFFLTPYHSKDGTVGGWTANTGELMCIFARQFGLSCDQLHAMMQEKFGQPVGPNLNAWSDAYGFWWEVFVVDWTYATSPIPTLRFILDPAPFEAIVKAVPDLGEALWALAPKLYDQFFGRVHPWASGFPFWLRESLDDPLAGELSRQFASYQFAETIQHNIGYKHQTTVIFDCPYLGMEDGFDYRRHKDVSETFDMTVEQATMPFYSTEPGSRDFVIDANSYMTHKMGAGTRHVLQRIFARREIMLLYEQLTETSADHSLADPDYLEAARAYERAADAAVAWRHREAYEAAIDGLEALDRHLTAQGQPDRLHTDWDAPTTFTPSSPGLAVDAATLEKDLKRLSGQ